MNYETSILESKRLKLMKGCEEDFLKVYEYDFSKLQNVDNTFEYVKSDNDKIKKCFKKGKESYYKKCEKAHIFDWIIYLDDNAIGNVLTTDEDINNKSVTLLINIHPNYWNKGYATESSVEVLDTLFKIGYDNIICNYVDGNEKARRVLNKLGFKPYGIDKDAYKGKCDIYKMILEKEDWLSRTSKIKL